MSGELQTTDDDRQRLEDVSAKMLAYLVEAFPSCFFVYGQRRRPLKIGIFDYTRAGGYLRACVEGADRIDLEGNAVGTVTAQQIAHAQRTLEQHERLRPKRRRQGRRLNSVGPIRRSALVSLG